MRRAASDAPHGHRGDELIVQFDGITYSAVLGEDVTFGRASTATVRVGPRDLHVHRRSGSFRWNKTTWELHNDGDTTSLQVHIAGGLAASIAVGSHPLTLPRGAEGSVRVMTPSPYVLDFSVPRSTPAVSPPEPPERDLEGLTIDPRTGLGLTAAELQMLVALCEPRLVDPRLPAFTIPSTKDVCSRLRITPKRAEDLLDSLVTKLAPHVHGVVGTNDGRAVNRRHRIAAFAIETNCVTRRDLRLLDQPG